MSVLIAPRTTRHVIVGRVAPGTLPVNAWLDDNGVPIFDDSGNYIIIDN